MLAIAEHQRTTAVLKDFRNLIRMKGRIQRNGRATGRDNAEVCSDPARMVVGEDCNSSARLKPVLGEPAPDALRHAPRLGVGVALYPVTALNLQRDVVGPAL